MKKVLSMISLWVMMVVNAVAQNKIPINSDDYSNNSVEMADALRDSGKIYVVVAVIIALWAGMTIYLSIIDKKVSRLEKMIKDQ